MAQKSGLSAEYVLFDSWFSSPKVVVALKQEHGLDTIAICHGQKEQQDKVRISGWTL